MNASWIILITLAFVQFSKSESNWFTKGTVKTVTYNEKGEKVTFEREMTDEEKDSLQKSLNQAKDEIAGIGEKVVRVRGGCLEERLIFCLVFSRTMLFWGEQTNLEGSRMLMTSRII